MLNPVELLKDVVSIASVSGQEDEVAKYLVTQMQSFAAESFVDEAGNAVARLGRGERRVVFLGHIDTVPGDIPVRIENGKLYGRGSVDAKGSFCTAVAAADRLPPEVLEKLSITLIGAVEEEAPSSKGARYALKAYPKPELVIIGEPSGWSAMTLGYKGRLVLKLELAKDNFHSAGDDSTAAEDMLALWQALREWVNTHNYDVTGIFDALQMSLQGIQSYNDGLTQRAEAVIGFRLPPRLPPAVVEVSIRKLLKDQAHMSFVGHEQPYRSPKDTALTRAFRSAIRQHGGQPRPKLKTGTSDMNVVAPHWDVPMLAYGPGDSALDHRPDEHLELAEYELAIDVLVAALTRLA